MKRREARSIPLNAPVFLEREEIVDVVAEFRGWDCESPQQSFSG